MLWFYARLLGMGVGPVSAAPPVPAVLGPVRLARASPGRAVTERGLGRTVRLARVRPAKVEVQ